MSYVKEGIGMYISCLSRYDYVRVYVHVYIFRFEK